MTKASIACNQSCCRRFLLMTNKECHEVVQWTLLWQHDDVTGSDVPAVCSSAYINSLTAPAARAAEPVIKTVHLALGVTIYSGTAAARSAREVELIKALHFEMHPMRERFPQRQAGYVREEGWHSKVPEWAQGLENQALLPVKLAVLQEAAD